MQFAFSLLCRLCRDSGRLNTPKEKCGADFVYLYEGCGKTQVTINDAIPHT